jgi:hypothetical protein
MSASPNILLTVVSYLSRIIGMGGTWTIPKLVIIL